MFRSADGETVKRRSRRSDRGAGRGARSAACLVATAVAMLVSPVAAQPAPAHAAPAHAQATSAQPPSAQPAHVQPTSSSPWAAIGRAVTAAELRAWDIDVRGDLRGLPAGSGSVEAGETLWDAKCASCHGVFGESNEVFAPIVGGTTRKDIETGRVENLKRPDYPQRTTLMKLSRISALWDYIRRAMPWNEPKTLTDDEVYAVTAYILHLGEIVPADFVLSDRNMAEIQQRLPNRDGMVFWNDLWDVRGKGDVENVACLRDCPVEGRILSSLPDHARDAHGNLALQHRIIGPVRGADTTQPPSDSPQQRALAALATAATPAAGAAAPAPASAAATEQLARQAGCLACHGIDNRLVGPGFNEVARRYGGQPDAVGTVAARVRAGSQGIWGPIPMPPHPQLAEDDTITLVKWILQQP